MKTVLRKTCLLCEGTKVTPVVSLPDRDRPHTDEIFTYVQCQTCGLIFLQTQIPESSIKNYYFTDYQPYHSEYNSFTESWIRRRTRKELARFRRLKPAIQSILDVGSSWGKYLNGLRELGDFRLVGLETSKEMCDIGNIDHRLDIRQGTLESAHLPSSSFDVIIMSHVIEHLYNPVTTLKEAYRVLEKDGVLFLKTPNVTTWERSFFRRHWCVYEPPRHTVLFSPTTMKAVLGKAGFRSVRIVHESIPNNMILSIAHWCRERNIPSSITNFFSLRNYLVLASLTPLGILASLFKSSGRMIVYAQK